MGDDMSGTLPGPGHHSGVVEVGQHSRGSCNTLAMVRAYQDVIRVEADRKY